MSEYVVLSCVFIFICILVSAFFSAAETALTAISRARIFQLVKEGNRRAAKVNRLRKDKESLLGALLIGNNAINIAASTIATSIGIQLFGAHDETVLGIVTLVMTLLIVIFAEVMPKTYALQYNERVALAVSPLVSLIVWLLTPITRCLRVIIRLGLLPFGVDLAKAASFISAADVLRGTIELHHHEGKMERQDRDMLGSILDLNDIEVRAIMVHRMHVDTLCADQPASKLVQEAVSMLHSRIPLWRDNPDNIIGVLYVKDLIRALNTNTGPMSMETILSIAQKPWFIPETTTLRDQLLAFRSRRQHFSIVVDEYGALLGIVTLEDIIEEIVGDIDDEHDEQQAAGIQKAGPNIYYVAGDVPIRDVNRELDWELPDDNASTIGGLVVHEARVIPAKGQHFDLHGFRFTVVDKNAKQVKRLRVEKITTDNDPALGL